MLRRGYTSCSVLPMTNITIKLMTAQADLGNEAVVVVTPHAAYQATRARPSTGQPRTLPPRRRVMAADLGAPLPFRKVTLGLCDEFVPHVGWIANGGMTHTAAVVTREQRDEVDRMLADGWRVIRAWDVDADSDGYAITHEVNADAWRPTLDEAAAR